MDETRALLVKSHMLQKRLDSFSKNYSPGKTSNFSHITNNLMMPISTALEVILANTANEFKDNIDQASVERYKLMAAERIPALSEYLNLQSDEDYRKAEMYSREGYFPELRKDGANGDHILKNGEHQEGNVNYVYGSKRKLAELTLVQI